MDSCHVMITRFAREFAADFCTDDRIDWEKLVRFNSQAGAVG